MAPAKSSSVPHAFFSWTHQTPGYCYYSKVPSFPARMLRFIKWARLKVFISCELAFHPAPVIVGEHCSQSWNSPRLSRSFQVFFCFVVLLVDKSSVECFTACWVSARFRRGGSKNSWEGAEPEFGLNTFSPLQDPATTSSGCPRRSQATGTRWKEPKCSAPSLPWTGQSHPTTTALVSSSPALGKWGPVPSAREMRSCLVFG